METKECLCEQTKALWHYYLLEPTEENFQHIVESLAEPFSMIGTGKHEIYNSLREAGLSISENLGDAKQNRFDLLDEWYEAVMIRDDAGIVYGGIWVREHVEGGSEALIEMDTRFSLVYTLNENDKWKIVHIHHSMPYFDQTENEYYPKALSAKMREAMELVELFRKRSEMDLMTGVYNHESFQKQTELCLTKEKELCFYVIDLDDFKAVNDTYGHSVGDSVLKYLARLLHKYFPENAVVGRLGGDEFAVCEQCSGFDRINEQRLLNMREEFQSGCRQFLQGKSASYSVGVSRKGRASMSYRQLYERADEALYRAKQSGKNRLTCHWETPLSDASIK